MANCHITVTGTPIFRLKSGYLKILCHFQCASKGSTTSWPGLANNILELPSVLRCAPLCSVSLASRVFFLLFPWLMSNLPFTFQLKHQFIKKWNMEKLWRVRMFPELQSGLTCPAPIATSTFTMHQQAQLKALPFDLLVSDQAWRRRQLPKSDVCFRPVSPCLPEVSI